MQITLCSIDMRRIVKGLYLVSKKYFFIRKKNWSAKAILIKNFNSQTFNTLAKSIAGQCIS